MVKLFFAPNFKNNHPVNTLALKKLKTYTVNIYRHVIGKNNVIGVNR